MRFEETLAAELTSRDMPHDDAAGARGPRRGAARAASQLPADQREALLMHHVQGWSFAEIAARLGIRVNAAKTRAFRGMRKLKEQFRA